MELNGNKFLDKEDYNNIKELNLISNIDILQNRNKESAIRDHENSEIK